MNGRQITAKQGQVTAIYRFIDRFIYLKCNDLQYAAQMIQQIEAKGGTVQKGRGWLKCDIYGKNTEATFGDVTVYLETDTDAEIRDKAYNFFLKTLKTAKFECEEEIL